MFFRIGSGGACPQHEARLEDYLEKLRAGRALGVDLELTAHLAVCRGCRRAIEEAQQGGRLVSEGREALPESLTEDPFFASRVAARIRGYDATRVAAADFWPALETLSLRLSAAALAVALVLAGWASWQGRAAQGSLPPSQEVARARIAPGEVRQVSARVLFPEMKRPPDNAGEAMLILASTENGRQR
jgi:hypothetical protein